jgi:hypothetical protein
MYRRREMKARKSEEKDDQKYLDGHTGWFIYTPASRNAKVAEFLEIPFVYCVGRYPGKTRNPEVVFIQPSRNLDQRNNKVEYLVVEDFEDICEIVDILERPATKEEMHEVENQPEHDMELARRGLL